VSAMFSLMVLHKLHCPGYAPGLGKITGTKQLSVFKLLNSFTRVEV
jgi:hypothetical protein